MATPGSKINGDLDVAWDEGNLGRDESCVRRSNPDRERDIENAAQLQMISVRLPKDLIYQLKAIAEIRGVGYQPLMRDMLAKFARSELLLIAKERIEKEQEEQMIAATMENRKRA